ncbi:hypothetical protein [Alteraurantiacibacter palmitatis]|uniref:Tetratricopeptide repeat protein n=1 Tax=Alteraurantiacibacter palmitatis TaxID=2054628 RepID=A0ABV7E172_9SPHN
MLRHSSSTALTFRKKGLASAVAMAVALAGGTMAVSSALVAPAAAQSYSRNFVSVYQPVANVVNAEGGDIASVAGQFPAIVAASVSADEQLATGSLLLQAGIKASNPAWQRQGLEMQVNSGKLAPETAAEFNYFIGRLAFDARDYAGARASLARATAAGYSAPDIEGIIADTYYQSGDVPAGLAYVRQQVAANAAAGRSTPEPLLLRALQAAYTARLNAESIDASEMLVKAHPTRDNWLRALQVALSIGDFDEGARLDLLRLMRVTNTLTERGEYITYIETADPRIMSNELDGVLTAAADAGLISRSDEYYEEVRTIIASRMAGDRADAPDLVADARRAATGRDALAAGDVLYSLSDYAGAEEMYALAIQKGGVDTNTVLTRLGMMQAWQGKAADAQATLSQVTGERAIVARMWAAYAATRG